MCPRENILKHQCWLSQACVIPCPQNARQQPLVEDELHEEDKSPAGTSTRLKWQSFLKRDHWMAEVALRFDF